MPKHGKNAARAGGNLPGIFFIPASPISLIAGVNKMIQHGRHDTKSPQPE